VEYRAYILKIKKQYVDDYLAAHQKNNLPRQVISSLAGAGFSQMIVFRVSNQEFVLFEQADDLKRTYARYLQSDEITRKFEARLSDMMETAPAFASDGTLLHSHSVPVIFYLNNENHGSFHSGRNRLVESRIYRMKLKETGINDYVRLHQKDVIWPGVLEALKKSGLEKMIIFQIHDQIFVFETAEDFEKMHRFLYSDEVSIQWGSKIAELAVELPHYDAEQGDMVFEKIPVIFHFEQGKYINCLKLRCVNEKA
jgi:L-rhamnose mutarotase